MFGEWSVRKRWNGGYRLVNPSGETVAIIKRRQGNVAEEIAATMQTSHLQTISKLFEAELKKCFNEKAL